MRDFACDGAQNDPIVWDRNGNGVADLMLLAVDTTMASPEVRCGARGGRHPDRLGGRPGLHDERQPGEPVHDHPAGRSPCTRTAARTRSRRGPAAEEPTSKLLVYVSSYPLGAGPTCGDTEFLNTANPYDEDPGARPIRCTA